MITINILFISIYLVGDVIFVVLYKNEKGHFQGRGTVEFGNANSVQKAIDKMNNYKLNGRKFIVEVAYFFPFHPSILFLSIITFIFSYITFLL